jgi:hypothetical protein
LLPDSRVDGATAPDGGGGPDVTNEWSDADPDVAVDAPTDAAPDAQPERAPDTEADAAPDVPAERAPDTESDAATNGQTDAVPDPEIDADATGDASAGDGPSDGSHTRTDGQDSDSIGGNDANVDPKGDRFSDLAAPVRVAADFDQDGFSDVVWQDLESGDLEVWYLTETTVRSRGAIKVRPKPSANWRAAAVADFDGDGWPDILWGLPGSSSSGIEYLSGSESLRFTRLPDLEAQNGEAWMLEGTCGVGESKVPELLWRESVSGEIRIWTVLGDGEFRQSRSVSNALNTPSSSGWDVVGCGPFQAMDSSDIFWHAYDGADSGRSIVWFMSQSKTLRESYSFLSDDLDVAPKEGWRAVGVYDFNGDAHPDVLWYQPQSGALQAWIMQDVRRREWRNFDTSVGHLSSGQWQPVPHSE